MRRHWPLLLAGGLLFFLLESNSAWAFHSWQRAQLSNGLTLLIVEKPDTPVVSLTLLIKGGTSAELPSQRGVSSLTVQALTQGTRQRSGDQPDRRGHSYPVRLSDRVASPAQGSTSRRGWPTADEGGEIDSWLRAKPIMPN